MWELNGDLRVCDRTIATVAEHLPNRDIMQRHMMPTQIACILKGMANKIIVAVSEEGAHICSTALHMA